MIGKIFVSVFVLILAPAIVAAQSAILLSTDDIFLTTELTKRTLGAPASGGMNSAPTQMCGFQIRGNHRSRANPRVEWDMNVDQINIGTGWIAGVTAGVFDVVGHERKARPPIVDLSFSIEGNPQTISARIVGAPNADNGIKAVLETESAYQVFSAFSDDTHTLTIVLKYADNSSDVLQIRGYHDSRKFGGEKNSFFNECLRGHLPPRGIQMPIP
jgi:hypothetical protein